MSELKVIIQAVQQAAQLTKSLQSGHFDANTKDDDSPVTNADYGAQAILGRAIQQHFPADGVMGEEGSEGFQSLMSAAAQQALAERVGGILGESVTPDDLATWLDVGRDQRDAERVWVIDPVDGTKGFVNDRYYAICVGLLEGGQPTQAVIGLPRSPLDVDGSIAYTAGDHVTVMALDGTSQRQVSASGRGADDSDLLILDSVRLPDEERQRAEAVRQSAGLSSAPLELYDSQLKYTTIAAGYGDVFVRLPRDIQADPHKAWDHVTGAALLRAAGGTFTDVLGQPVDFTQGEILPHLGFVASNGNPDLHATLLKAIREITGDDLSG